MAQVIKFASDIDGKEFNTQAEQLAYDASIKNKAVIDQFLDKHYPATGGKKQGPSRAIVGKGIALWMAEQAMAEEAEEAAE